MSVSEFALGQQGIVIVDAPRDGAANMAIDEALLANAKPTWPVVMRIYRWTKPTLSLGHFQTLDDSNAFPSLAGIDTVRRRTGGGAIVHDHELTYSLVIPQRRAGVTKGHSEQLYRAVHIAAVDMLCELGWEAKLSEACTCAIDANSKSESFLCFLRRSPVDLVVGPYKILGSAQRRTSAGLLQHGSFLLRSSPFAPGLLGLLDLDRRSSETIQGVKNARQVLQEPRNLLRVKDDSDNLEASPVSVSCDSGSDAQAWIDLMIEFLKKGISQMFACEWRNGGLSEILGDVDSPSFSYR